MIAIEMIERPVIYPGGFSVTIHINRQTLGLECQIVSRSRQHKLLKYSLGVPVRLLLSNIQAVIAACNLIAQSALR